MKNKIAVIDEHEKLRLRVCKTNSFTDFVINESFNEKFLNVFSIGNFYYILMNVVTTAFEVVSKDVTKVLGYQPEKISLDFALNCIHPEDLAGFLNSETAVVDFMETLTPEKKLKYKARYDYRMKTLKGDYIRILQQILPIEVTDEGDIIRALIIHTDITEIKKSNKTVLSFIGLEGEPSFVDVKPNEIFSPSEELFTPREKEILNLLAEGKKSKEISEKLFISKVTVDRHRNNMLSKTECVNVLELVNKGINEGWI